MESRVNPVLSIAVLGVLLATQVVTLASDTAFALQLGLQAEH